MRQRQSSGDVSWFSFGSASGRLLASFDHGIGFHAGDPSDIDNLFTPPICRYAPDQQKCAFFRFSAPDS